MITASELMTPRPVAIRSTDSVSEAVRILQELEIRHLPVVNEQQEPVGMLSDRDLRSLSVPVLLDDEWLGTARSALDAPVASLMTASPLSVELEADAAEVVDLMLDNKVGAIPVVDAEGRLAGIVSYVDVLRRLSLE